MVNMNALGIIFPNTYDELIPELVHRRTMASVPFGIPVSDTHRDVYKRQAIDNLSKSFAETDGLFLPIHDLLLFFLTNPVVRAYTESVSYTHLDVYKRQVQ